MHWVPAICLIFLTASPLRAQMIAEPAALNLSGPKSQQYLLLSERTADGRTIDRTRDARFAIADTRIASITPAGLVRGLADGSTLITATVGSQVVKVPVSVTGTSIARSFHFENDITPLLTRFGCNSSGCHGKAEGQNGFKLSVFGFDPSADYAALIKEGRGRRIFPAAPERSLLLTKASGQVPHGGGNRIPVNSEAFDTIRAWIAAGAPLGEADVARVESVRIEPGERVMGMRAEQQLRVIARWTDGRERDVTTQVRFQSNNEPVAVVSAEGIVRTSDIPGEAAAMAGYLGEVANFRLVVPRPGKVEFTALPVNNFIDPLVDAKLRKLNIAPSPGVDDATFLRRVYLDIIGTLPSPAGARAFTADTRADKRAKLVDALLERPEYADYWSLKWADVLRVDRSVLGHKRAYAYYRWLRDAMAENKRFDALAKDLITAEGPLDESPPANFYRVVPKPGEAASVLSQVFLGVRIACAECHHHPYDRWSQDDYYRMSAFFAPVGLRKVANLESIAATGEYQSRNPRTNTMLKAQPLGARGDADPADGNGRLQLAEWLIAADNPFFARNVVNRYWAHFMGRGIIDPVDDVRSTNPPSNPELLDALAKNFHESKFDLKALVRTIVLSRVYQTSSQVNDSNTRDEQNYSRALFRRPDAEVLLDMVCQTTGVPDKFDGFPTGTRALDVWDSKVKHYFLKTFGRPTRTSACECERNDEANIAGVLHLLNGETITAKLRHDAGTLAMLLRDQPDDAKLTEELYLRCYSRLPTPAELATVKKFLAKGNRRDAFEDIFWALLNSKEFLFNH